MMNINLVPRPYRDERDISAMRDILIEGRKANTPTYYVHTGDLNWWLHYLNQDESRQGNITLWEDANKNNEVIGWSLLSPNFLAFDIFIHPEANKSGIDEHILNWTENLVSQVVREKGGKKIYTTWIAEDDLARIAILESKGFTRDEYHLHYMSLDLDSFTSKLELPEGYHLRPVTGEHEVSKRAAVGHAAFGSSKPFKAYTQNYLRFMRSPTYPSGYDLVAVAPDGYFAAFCIPWMDPISRVGYFEPVGTHPDYRRLGLGRSVIQEGLILMRQAGMTTGSVCVEYDNSAGRGLYESVGFRIVKDICSYFKEI
jgi:ribosomal protein S18 acetylase RimI-like enzyme